MSTIQSAHKSYELRIGLFQDCPRLLRGADAWGDERLLMSPHGSLGPEAQDSTINLVEQSEIEGLAASQT